MSIISKSSRFLTESALAPMSATSLSVLGWISLSPWISVGWAPARGCRPAVTCWWVDTCTVVGTWPGALQSSYAGKDGGKEDAENLCLTSMTSEWFPCPVGQWACIFPVLLLTTHISVDTFLVILDIFGQFQFCLSLSVPDCISVCPGKDFAVLGGYLAAFPWLACVLFSSFFHLF